MRCSIRKVTACATLLVGLIGCAAKPDKGLVETAYCGQLGLARQHMIDQLRADKRTDAEKAKDKDFILNELRTGVCTLGDGYFITGDRTFNKVYEAQQKSGVNKDTMLGSFILNEQDVKTWKGDPFEQALGLTYIAMNAAAHDSWDNARAVAKGSLFTLKDFGNDAKGKHLSKVELITRAVDEDKKHNKSADATDGYLDKGYVARETNFALGYLMVGLANQEYFFQSGDKERWQEADQNYNQAIKYNPDLAEVVNQLRKDPFNTILVVDYGRGPQKIATGTDGVIADYAPITPSSPQRLLITNGAGQQSIPVACDVNAMATDHMWQSFEDMRKAKSALGNAMLAGGAGVAAYGASQGDTNTELVGLGMMVLGTAMKAESHADTRYCEVLPQRIYVAPLMITGNEAITLEVEGAPQSRLCLTGLTAPRGKRTAQLRYVRLVSEGTAPASWAVSGQICYANDYAPNAGQVKLPYILGGDDVRTPSEEALSSYQAQGFLQGYTLSQLDDLYRAEGIDPSDDQQTTPGLHVLEGGKSLVAPLPGTLGFARLFGARHSAYQAASPQVKALQAQYAGKVAALRGGQMAMN